MSKNIVILNGSTRPKDKITQLIQAFTEGAQDAGNAVSCFDLNSGAVRSCETCSPEKISEKTTTCATGDKDDCIYQAYSDADLFVLAISRDHWNITGPVKNTFEHLCAKKGGAESLVRKESILLFACETNQSDESIYFYDRMVSRFNWRDRGRIVYNGKKSSRSPELDRARALGKSL